MAIVGNVVNIWSLGPTGAPSLVDSVVVPGIGTVSDVQVSDDGTVLVFGAERGPNAGLFVYGLTDPRHPAFLDSALVETGIHTATIADIGGRRYVFAARNPVSPALLIYDITNPSSITLIASVPIPPAYGIHDTYVRDGLAFVFAWNTGLIIYDVGNGIRSGIPGAPVEVGRLLTSDDGVSGGAQRPQRLVVPQPGDRRETLSVHRAGGAGSDRHAIERRHPCRGRVRPRQPRRGGFYHLDGAGTHNFWMDEGRQILYAAYYNGGVVALDVSGTLSGDLSNRLIGRIAPGGAGDTYVWGVQLSGGSLYAIDMLSGLWQLAVP